MNELLVSRPISESHKKERHFEMTEELACLIGDLRILKKAENIKDNPQAYKEKSLSTFRELTNFFLDLGAKEYKDVSRLYNKYTSGRNCLVVRKEDPEKVVTLAAGQEQELFFDPKVAMERGDKYSNCAIWPYGHSQVAGIANAFLEGRHMAGPLALVIAVKTTGNHLQVEIPEDAILEVGSIKREAVRILSGTIKPEDLEFVILRAQKDYYPETMLTDEENKSQVRQIFRAYSFTE